MKILYVLFIIVEVFASDSLDKHIGKPQSQDLQSIIKRRYLRVLTTRNPYDYYIYQGRTKGIQYEMVKEFTKYLNRKYVQKGELRIVFEMIPVEFNQLIPMLTSGRGDLIAVGLTSTDSREKLVDFTTPYRVVDEVIVTRKELVKNNWRDKIFHVQNKSSYLKSLQGHKVKVEQVNANFNAADVMELISLKKYDYTLVNSFWANTLIQSFPNLAILDKVPFRKKIEISWATQKGNNTLLSELNSFLPKVKKGSLLGNIFSNKYFRDVNKIQSEGFDLNTSTISKFDKTIKKYANQYNLDWRLLAAVCYQESKFNQEVTNKWGAIGLFQVKQMTANEPYINIKEISGKDNFDNNIHAGVKYLSWIKKRYFDSNKKMLEETRLRMTLAAYNAGPARVLRAIKKAKNAGLDPNKWFRNVELAMLKMGYPEPVVYVSEINKHFVSYVLLGIKSS